MSWAAAAVGREGQSVEECADWSRGRRLAALTGIHKGRGGGETE